MNVYESTCPPLKLLMFCFVLFELKVSVESFQTAFGVSIDQAQDLIASKTITIHKLLVLCPAGTADPTPHLYDTTMYAMGGLMALGVISHYLVKPTHAVTRSESVISVPLKMLVKSD